MPSSFAVLWTLERCRWLQRAQDRGPLEVIFGGPHTSLPSIDAVSVGDAIYPICIVSGELNVIARIDVSDIMSPDEYVQARLGFTRPATRMWDELFQEFKRSSPGFGHRLPTTCCEKAAVGSGTELLFSRAISAHQLETLTFGPKPGRERPLKGVSDGRLRNVFAFQGHVRRLSEKSAGVFAEYVG